MKKATYFILGVVLLGFPAAASAQAEGLDFTIPATDPPITRGSGQSSALIEVCGGEEIAWNT